MKCLGRSPARGCSGSNANCFSLGSSRVHHSVRQTGAEAFGCSVRRCGQLVVVSLEPTVRELLSTSFLKTAWDRPGAAESESSVHAALRGVPQLRAPGTRRTAGLRMSRERPVSPPRRDCHGGCAPQRAQGRKRSSRSQRPDRKHRDSGSGDNDRDAKAEAGDHQGSTEGGQQPKPRRSAQRPPGQHQKRPATPTAGRPPPPGSGAEAASKAPAEDRGSTTAAEAAAPGRQVQ